MQFLCSAILQQICQFVLEDFFAAFNVIAQKLINRYIKHISQMNDGRQAQFGIAGFNIADIDVYKRQLPHIY